jgi:hypothetical protein
MREVALQFVAKISQPLQILGRTAHATLGFAPTLLILGDPRCLFDEHPQLFRLGLDQARYDALLDNRVAARPQTRAQKQIRDIAPATLCAIKVVL